MNHRASPKFWHYYQQLPPEVQRLANASYKLLRHEARHPSLHFKRIGRLWSVRVGLHHRALAVADGDEVGWFWIGTHAEYDALLKRLA